MELPPTLVINLSTRPDRWASVQNDFRTWNLPMERMNAVQKKPGWKGCTLSHKKCIQMAKERNYPWVLILEDDAIPTDTGYDHFIELLPILWNSRDSWDVFNGGISVIHSYTLIQKSPPLFRATGWATQFCLVNMQSYDKFMNTLDDDPKKPIDVHYTEDDFRMLCTYPQLSIQKAGKSDIESKEISYVDNFQKVNDKLRWEVLMNNEVLMTTILLSLSITLFSLAVFRKRK